MQSSAAALAASLGLGREVLMGGESFEDFKPFRPELRAAYSAQKAFGNEGKKPLRLGLIIGIGNDPDAAMAKVHELRVADVPGVCD